MSYGRYYGSAISKREAYELDIEDDCEGCGERLATSDMRTINDRRYCWLCAENQTEEREEI